MSDSSDDEHEHENPSKKQRPSGPTTFVTWNANGLVSRCSYNKDELRKLVNETRAEIFTLQEVRLKAAGSSNRGTPLPSDYQSIKEVMDTVFAEYDKHWSLADKRYAGTLTLIHKNLQFARQDSAFTTKSAIALLLKKYGLTREEVGLPEVKKAPSSSPKKKQSTMTAFFAPKNKNSTGGNSTTTAMTLGEHNEEGRFQFFSFDRFDFINTYVPNNGTKEESFARRRLWDEQIKSFFAQRKLILQKAKAIGRPLLWSGDMNCAMTYRDGTHWENTRENNNSSKPSNSDTPGFYEWWRDESQCFVRDAAKKLEANREPGDIGIPSFTTNERIRFAEIFREGDLKDVWRAVHPNGVTKTTGSDDPTYKTPWDLPNWTWRGHRAKDGNNFGSKYEGKGQRLDYFLLSPSSITSNVVESCDILGYGTNRLGLYCGSDHCATMLKLKNPF